MGEYSDLLIRAAALIAAGLASGFLSGLFGVGGGIVRIPLFLYLLPYLGVAESTLMHVAQGTSLALAIPSTASASVTHYRAGMLDAGFLRTWLPALSIGVVAGVLGAGLASGSLLRAIFAIGALGAALEMIATSDDFRITEKLPGAGVHASLAAAIGGLSTLLGLTGGVFVTPALTALGHPIHRAVAIATAGGVVISIIGTAGALWNGLGAADLPDYAIGYIDYMAVGVMLPAVLLTAPAGARLGHRFDKRRMKKLFGAFLLIVAADMLHDALG